MRDKVYICMTRVFARSIVGGNEGPNFWRQSKLTINLEGCGESLLIVFLSSISVDCPFPPSIASSVFAGGKEKSLIVRFRLW